MLASHTTSTPVLPLVVQIVIKMADHVFDGLISPLWIESILDGFGRFHQVVDVDTGSVAEDAPDDAGQIEEKCLD